MRRGDGDSVVTYPGAARADVVGRGENLRSAGNFTSSRLAFSEACVRGRAHGSPREWQEAGGVVCLALIWEEASGGRDEGGQLAGRLEGRQ